ncbi:MAG: hypothetical protein A2W25_08335 [candidate division Zixibacteria bacterium RBG_16_53_22]|nr:MAG: hypothetical protein A2W25_08335 [candidate division Zixibacteria bacterium RBG_16_53_22]
MTVEISAGLYAHIPFCKNLCLYCDFYSKIGSGSEIERYLDSLTGEAALLGREYVGYRYDTVFLGGGTPSILEPVQIRRLFDSLRSAMRISTKAEITIECNPSSLTSESLENYKAIGINRISLGVQSFDDRHLRRLGRTHTAAEARAAFELVRRCGFDNISVDLIYGLPDQTLEEWTADLDQAIEFGPGHISAYNLIIEDETPFGELYRRGELDLPPDSFQGEMYATLKERLGGAGYARYEISNFARPGRECRHNLKYWRLEPYIGLGPSAVSSNLALRWKNKPDLDSYLRSLESGQPPPHETEELTPEKTRQEYIMLSLRLAEGLSLDELKTRYDYDLIRERGESLKALASNELVVIDGDRVRLADKGLFISDEIIVKLI